MLGANLERLHSLSGVKWTNDPDRDVIPSWVADMDFEVSPAIKDAMQAVVERGDTGYNFHAKQQLIEAWGDWQERHFGWRPPEEESMGAFKDFMGIASSRKYFGELKRPQPPWPRGVRD